MSYTDLRDFSAELTYTDSQYGVTIQVEKLGGGTLGKKYDGIWRYIATHTNTDEEITRGQDYETGTPKEHDEVAEELAAYVVEMYEIQEVPDDDG